MKINIDTKELDLQLSKIKALKSNWVPTVIDFESIDLSEIKSIRGKEISIGEITTSDHGLIIFKGRPQMLYIRDVQVSQNVIKNQPESSRVRRFHVARNCEVLKKMEKKGRYDRYRITENKTGYFEVDAYEDENCLKIIPIKAKLKVCKACLLELNYFGINTYSDLDHNDWIDFNINDFFKSHQPSFKKPKFNSFNSPGSDYPNNWNEISRNYKKSQNWMCERCHLKLIKHRNLLHCHHKNGVKGDVSSSNLEALCTECHSKEHGKISSILFNKKTKSQIKNLRTKQGI